MTTYDKIPEILRLNNCTYWTIRSKKDTNSYIFKCEKDSGFDDNLSRMQNVMNLYKGSYFILEGKENSEANRGSFTFEFSNENTSYKNQPAEIVGIGSSISESDINSRIENATNAVRLEFEKKDLERRERDLEAREKEYREEKASTIGIIVDKIGKVLPRIFPQVAVAGMQDEHVHVAPSRSDQHDTEGEISEIGIENSDIENLLERFSAVEPEWYRLLNNIVEMAERKDSTYTMARNFLLQK